MMSFERLMREHDHLDQIRRRLLVLVDGGAAPAEALSLLSQFSVEIEQHRAYEKKSVYEPLLRIARSKPSEIGIDLEVMLSQMEVDWSSYLHDWDVESLSGDWATFVEDTRYILGRAGERLRLENDLIYPMALQKGAITFKEARA